MIHSLFSSLVLFCAFAVHPLPVIQSSLSPRILGGTAAHGGDHHGQSTDGRDRVRGGHCGGRTDGYRYAHRPHGGERPDVPGVDRQRPRRACADCPLQCLHRHARHGDEARPLLTPDHDHGTRRRGARRPLCGAARPARQGLARDALPRCPARRHRLARRHARPLAGRRRGIPRRIAPGRPDGLPAHRAAPLRRLCRRRSPG